MKNIKRGILFLCLGGALSACGKKPEETPKRLIAAAPVAAPAPVPAAAPAAVKPQMTLSPAPKPVKKPSPPKKKLAPAPPSGPSAATLAARTAAPKQPESGTDLGQKLPDFSLKSLTGQPMSLGAEKGRAVLLYFCASWAGPCKSMSGAISRWNREYAGDNFTVLGVHISDTPERTADFADKNNLVHLIALDGKENPLAISCGVAAIPAFYLIGPDGKTLWKHLGAFGMDLEFTVEKQIKKALAL